MTRARYPPGMATEWQRVRCRERIESLASSADESEALRRQAIEILHTAIGFDRWCTLLLDPDTLVISQGIGHIDWFAELPRLNLHEAGLSDVNNHAVLARSRDHVGVLSAATGGDLARSTRWREIFAGYGVGDELGCVAADERGCWGDIRLYRNSDDPPFDADDARLMRDVSALLARALRRSAVAPINGSDSAAAEMGVLLLNDELRPGGATDAARSWFDALNPARIPFPDGVPGLVWNVVGRLIAGERGEDPGRPPRVRARTGGGRWAVVEAARLDGGEAGIAVSVRAAGVEDVLALVSRASGLTPRERELVALLIEGLDTRELATRLFISRHTVQDHLKSVFAKVGVRSRRELVSSVFAQAA
jgi:DNA-binding CsgD family transcriptional regulator